MARGGRLRADPAIAAGLDVVAARAHILAATAFEVSGLAGRAGAGVSHHGAEHATKGYPWGYTLDQSTQEVSDVQSG